jgi:hypothetical protein
LIIHFLCNIPSNRQDLDVVNRLGDCDQTPFSVPWIQHTCSSHENPQWTIAIAEKEQSDRPIAHLGATRSRHWSRTLFVRQCSMNRLKCLNADRGTMWRYRSRTRTACLIPVWGALKSIRDTDRTFQHRTQRHSPCEKQVYEKISPPRSLMPWVDRLVLDDSSAVHLLPFRHNLLIDHHQLICDWQNQHRRIWETTLCLSCHFSEVRSSGSPTDLSLAFPNRN